MKKNLQHINAVLYNSPWLVLPSFHKQMVRDYTNYINGTLKADMPSIDPEDEPTEPDDTVPKLPVIANGIQVIPINGVLGTHLSMLELCYGCTDMLQVANDLRSAVDNPNVSTIVLYINSPGGTVMGTENLANLIAEIDTVKPVVAYIESAVCASAAYWLASQTRSIFTTSDSVIGSVGVYRYMEDCSEMLKMQGIQPNCIVSTKSPKKISGADFQPLSEADRAMFQKDVDETYTLFSNSVLSKRSIKPELLDGNVYSGRESVANGYADALCDSFDDLLKYITGTTTTTQPII